MFKGIPKHKKTCLLKLYYSQNAYVSFTKRLQASARGMLSTLARRGNTAWVEHLCRRIRTSPRAANCRLAERERRKSHRLNHLHRKVRGNFHLLVKLQKLLHCSRPLAASLWPGWGKWPGLPLEPDLQANRT